MARIGIPTNGTRGLDEPVGEHFGRVTHYTLVDIDTDEVEVVPNTSNHMGGQKYPPEVLREVGVGTMLCRGLGRRAIGMFEEMGVAVHIGAMGTARETLAAFRAGQLPCATQDDSCVQHAFHDQHQYD